MNREERLISIHALREEGDGPGTVRLVLVDDFYPRPPRGGRLLRAACTRPPWIFLSTPSARRATSRFYCQRLCRIYFYPRPPRGGRHAVRKQSEPDLPISIHALREEGDPAQLFRAAV